MPVFEYVALNGKGKNTSGIIDADSALAARQKIRSRGSFPITIREVQDVKSKKTPAWEISFTRHLTRIRSSEVALMTRQLSTLLSAGLPLVTALDTLVPTTKSHAFKAMLARIKDTIVEGNSFANALALYPNAFSSLYINMVRAGESSGTLEIVLSRLADITEKQQILNHRIKSALAYPVLMALIGTIILFFLLTVVVPQITTIFTDMGRALPLPTRMLIATSNFFKSWWWVILAAIGGLIFGLRRLKKSEAGRTFFARNALTFPVFGNLFRKLAIARFSRTLGSLLENGVTMLLALDIVKNISDNILISRAVEKASENVGKGLGLARSLSENEVFPALAIQMIQVGEQSGDLEPMLNKIADIYEREAEAAILGLTTLLEPVMILLMAVAVGFIVLSIALPIFEMNRLVM